MRGGVASEATMNFEGRKANAGGEGEIKKLLAAHTSYMSLWIAQTRATMRRWMPKVEEEYDFLHPN